MESKHTLGITCTVLLIITALTILCLIAAGGVFFVANRPNGLRQYIAQRFSPPTATPIPTTTATPTQTPTPAPPTATPLPTAIPENTSTATPVLASPTVAAPPTDTPAAQPTATETPALAYMPAPTDTPIPPSPTPATPPTDTPVPAPTVEPFLPIGTRAELSPQANGATGSAVLFSPRQLTIINLNYDGKCPVSDIRLGMEGFPKPPVAVLQYLEERPYKNESFPVEIPADLPAGSANALFVYCDSRDEMLAWGPLLSPQP